MTIRRLMTQIGNTVRGAYEMQPTLRAVERQVVSTAVVNIKTPPCYDWSHWTGDVDWPNLSPMPLLVLTKATESDNYRDPTFPEFFAQFKAHRINRGAYHFFRKSADPVRQANWFVDYIAPYLEPKDIVVLDFEEGGETAAQLWGFWNRVTQRIPNQRMNYSRKNLMDPISMTQGEKDYFTKIPSWPAGYPTDPNPYASTPVGYIPDPMKWGTVWLWQYSASGVVQGVDENAVDLNLMEGPILDYLGATVPPEPPPSGGTMQAKVMETGLNPDINIRPTPGNTSIDLGDLNAGDVIDYDKKQAVTTGSFTGDWYHITKVTRANGSIDAPPVDWWCWGKNLQDVSVPPPTSTVADMPYTVTFGGGVSPYVEKTISGVIEAK